MPTLNDLQLSSWETLTGNTGQLNDLLVEYLQSLAGIASNNPNDLWYKVLTDLGYTGAVQDMQLEYWADITGKTGAWNDLYYEWLLDTGGAFGPNVNIVLASGGSCTFQPDVTTDCTAVGTYTANDSGFTNPANTWLWTIEPPVVGVDLTDATLKTCTVTTPTSDANLDFNLKVVATDSVSTDTANRTTAFTQTHTDTNTVPVFVGPPVNDVTFQQDVPISAFDFSVVFTGTNLAYDNTGVLPAGLVLDPATGILTGTPTVVESQPLTVTATNSKGVAVTNSFDMEIINQSQILTVAEVAAGSCNYLFPQTGCTAQGTYDATPSGWTLPPDTWVWSITTITSGLPVITAGQGTDTVTVDSTGPDNAGFTLKCVASNASEGAQDLTQFSQVHTDDTVAIAFDGPNIADPTFTVDELFTLDVSSLFSGNPISTWALLGSWPNGSFVIDGAGVITGTAVIGDVGAYPGLGVRASNAIPDSADSNTFSGTVAEAATGPQFYALTPDETTYEMLGVSIGTGGLTTTHTADLYASDFEGVYREYVANEPVWSGGRQVRNYCKKSADMSTWNQQPIGPATVTYGISDPNGGTDAARVNTNGETDVNLASTTGNSTPVGFQIRVSFWIKRVSGTGSEQVRAYVSQAQLAVIPSINTAWQRIQMDIDLNLSNNAPRMGFRFVSGGGEFDVYGFQHELVSGQANQNASEYVPTPNAIVTKTYANENGNTVLANVVTEAVGTPLPEVPYLQYYPAAENDVGNGANTATNSSDLRLWATEGTPPVSSYDQIGVTGEPNTATLIGKSDGTSSTTRWNRTIPATTEPITFVSWIKKDLGALFSISWRPRLTGGTAKDSSVFLDLTDGSFTTAGAALDAVEVIDDGDWWKLMAQQTQASNTSCFWYHKTTQVDTDIQSVTYGQMEIHLGKTIAQVRGLGPIFTTTAAVSTDKVLYTFTNPSSDGTQMAFYNESIQQGSTSEAFEVYCSGVPSGTNWRSYWGNTGTTLQNQRTSGQAQLFKALNLDNLRKSAGVFSSSENKSVVNTDGVYGTEGTWGTFTVIGDMQLQRLLGQLVPMKFRNWQHYDITSYAEGKTIIDGLMAEVLVAEDDSELTTETDDSLTKG